MQNKSMHRFVLKLKGEAKMENKRSFEIKKIKLNKINQKHQVRIRGKPT